MPRYTNTSATEIRSLGGNTLNPGASIQLLEYLETLPDGVIQQTLAATDTMFWPVVISAPGGGGVGDAVNYTIPDLLPYSTMPVKGIKIYIKCVAGALTVKFNSGATGFSDPGRLMVANDVWEYTSPRGVRLIDLVNITASAISTTWQIHIEAA